MNTLKFKTKKEFLNYLKKHKDWESGFTRVEVNKVIADQANLSWVTEGYFSVYIKNSIVTILYRDFLKLDLSNVYRKGGGFSSFIESYDVTWYKYNKKYSVLEVNLENSKLPTIFIEFNIKEYFNKKYIDNGLYNMTKLFYNTISDCLGVEDSCEASDRYDLWDLYAFVGSNLENYLFYGFIDGDFEIPNKFIELLIKEKAIYELKGKSDEVIRRNF